MASIFGHAIAAVGIGSMFPESISKIKFYTLGIICAVIPDLDVIGFYTGIPYESLIGHRGITHSIFFAVLLAFILTLIFYRKANKNIQLLIGAYLFIATISHAILDALTTGGRGVAFFAPFIDDRYFLPWRFIQVSPIGISNFFSTWGLRVLISEMIFIAFPALLLFSLSRLIRSIGT